MSSSQNILTRPPAGSGAAPDTGVTALPALDDPVQSESGRLFEKLWLEPDPPDVCEFLSQRRSLTPAECVEVIQVDQARRWPRGIGLPTETYLRFLKSVGLVADDLVEWALVISEFTVLSRQRSATDGDALLTEFCARFPHLSDRLRRQVTAPDSDPTRPVLRPAEPAGSDPLAATRVNVRHPDPIDLDATTLDIDSGDGSSLTLEAVGVVHDPLSVLGRCTPFAKLPPVLVRRIEDRMQRVRFEPGEYLMRQGEAGDGLFVLTKGWVRIEAADPSGQSHAIAESGPGEILGEMALLTDEPRTASVVATEPVEASFLPGKVFDEMASEYPVISRLLTQLLAERLGHSGRDALAGKTLNRYRIRQRLGRGGMAIVYQAEDLESAETVALKMMSHRLVYDADSLRLFQREASIIESFDHPNIVRMLGRFKAFRSYFIVMEFCDGVSLDRISRQHGPLPEVVVRLVLTQLATALRYAHDRNVVHRDIKPSNVMLTRTGDVKLMDFGLANPLDEGSTTGHIAGTPRYMAPEQLRGEPVDTRADLFAFGMTAWKLITGRDLITEKSLIGIQKRHAAWKIPPLEGVPEDLTRLIESCLSLTPAERSLDALLAQPANLEPPAPHFVARLMEIPEGR